MFIDKPQDDASTEKCPVFFECGNFTGCGCSDVVCGSTLMGPGPSWVRLEAGRRFILPCDLEEKPRPARERPVRTLS